MRIGQVRGWAIARLGLDRKSFGLLRIGEFWEAMVVWSEDRDADRRQLFQLIRNVGHSLFNLQLDKKDKIPPEKYIPLPWDDIPEDAAEHLRNMTDEEKKASLESLRKVINW